jgi:basic membrane protein A
MVCFLLILASCSKSSTAPADQPGSATGTEGTADGAGDKPRVAFVYIGVPGDGGWTYQHDLARQAVEEKFGIKATVMENVPDNADAERVFTELAMNHDIIFGTSFGYMDAIYNVARKFPDVQFLHSTGYKTAENMSTYIGRDYEAGYLSGIAAGMLTKNNKLGYVGAFPIPEVINTINGFVLGAQSVNPDVEVSVVWSNTWFDPAIEQQAAISLLDAGVDVLATYQDSPAGIQAAAERNAWGIGNDSDMSRYVPETYITNPVWNFAPFYSRVIESVMNGTWKAESYVGNLADGMVDIAPFGKNVPQDVRDLVEQKKKEIIEGTFHIFDGPLYDQDGNLRAGEGERLSDEDIFSMDWFVKGVNGAIPK